MSGDDDHEGAFFSEREFGPAAGLRRRRLWGGLLIVAVLAFLGFVVGGGVSGGGSGGAATGAARGMFEGDTPTAEGPSVWLLAIGTMAVLVVALTAHRWVKPKDD
jgi:hypothetical protein